MAEGQKRPAADAIATLPRDAGEAVGNVGILLDDRLVRAIVIYLICAFTSETIHTYSDKAVICFLDALGGKGS